MGVDARSADTRGRASRALRRWAIQAPASVFPIIGAGGGDAVRRLRLCAGVETARSPRNASVLLVAGVLPPALARPAIRVHDQMSHPRGTLFWVDGVTGDPDEPADRRENSPVPPRSSSGVRERFFPFAAVNREGASLEDSVRSLYRSLLTGERTSEIGIQPDRPPRPWRGQGPYGHGGKGMTGGAPYGRPLPQRGRDPDGLQLDSLHVRVGPFFPAFPPGLQLSIEFQGDVIRGVRVEKNPFAGSLLGRPPDLFLDALRTPVRVADLELARAVSHLTWMSDALTVMGLTALGVRAMTLALMPRPTTTLPASAGLRKMLRRLERMRSGAWATAGVGELIRGDLSGPVSRAAGIEADARSDDPAYAALGFRPVTQTRGDARARWHQRIAECRQSLDLAERAGDRRTRPTGTIETPRGTLSMSRPMTVPGAAVLPDLLPGMEWGDAVTTIMSLDLDLEAEERYRVAVDDSTALGNGGQAVETACGETSE